MLSYKELLKKAKNNADLKRIQNEILELRGSSDFEDLSQGVNNSLGFYQTEIEDYVFKNFGVKLWDFRVYPEDFLSDLFA